MLGDTGFLIICILAFRVAEVYISYVTLNFMVFGVALVDFALVALPILAEVRSIKPILSVFELVWGALISIFSLMLLGVCVIMG